MGCFPGKTEFTIKTSEIRKAMRGEAAHIIATVHSEYILSNAYSKVSFGNGAYSNGLDVVRAMIEKEGSFEAIPFGKDNKSAMPGDKIRMWIEEPKDGDGIPVFKSEISIEVLLATKPVLDSLRGSTNSMELCVLEFDANNGRIWMKEIDDSIGFNQRISLMYGFLIGQVTYSEFIFGKEKSPERSMAMIVPATIMFSMMPTFLEEWEVEIIGDDSPVHIVAEDVKINGKTMEKYEGYVKQGDRVRMALNKHKHDKYGGIRFLLD